VQLDILEGSAELGYRRPVAVVRSGLPIISLYYALSCLTLSTAGLVAFFLAKPLLLGV